MREFMGSPAVGGIYLCVCFLLVVGLVVFLFKKFGKGMAEKERDRKIELGMRIGYRDELARERIAKKMREELEGEDDR